MRVWLLGFFLIAILGVEVWLFESGVILSRESLDSLTVITWIALIAILIIFLPKAQGSICFLYFLSFSVFHVGLVIATSFSAITDIALLAYISTWFYTETSYYAIFLANIGSLAFVISALIFSRHTDVMHVPAPENNISERVAHIGGAFLILTVSLFAVLLYSTGAYSSYSAYLTVVRNSASVTQIVSWIYVFIGISVVLISSCFRTKSAKWYLAIFALWGVFAFQLGLRGEVMFPGMVALCLIARQQKFLGATSFLVILIVFLVMAGIVRNARSTGDYQDIEYINPFNAVAEMGSSLRAVYETVSWRQSGDEYIWGQSYWAPFERQLATVVPGIDRLPAREDHRLLNVLIQERAGTYGYSPVAEAFRNFGSAGVVLVMSLFGMLMSWMDRVRPSMRSNVLIGAALVPLFIHIRNSFGPVPVQIFISISVCLLVMAVARVRFKSNQAIS